MDPAPRNSSIEEKSSSEDKELALAFNRGEKGAYDAIYFRYSPRVQGVCRRMLNDPHDAQEASQEAFLRVYQALPRFNGRYQLGAWIARITTNVCLDQLRSKGRRPVDLTPADELEEGQLADEIDEPEAWVMRKAESNRVRKVLQGMPPMHRAAIVLRDFEGLSYEEVAIALDISECQVKALIHRARKNFRRSWSPLSVAGVFPLRWFRRSDLPGADRAAEVARSASPLADAATSVTHAASSCSMALQQCGHFLTERFAAVVTTATITTVAVGSAAGLVEPVQNRPLPEAGASGSASTESTSQHLSERAKTSSTSAPKPMPGSGTQSATGEAAPSASPTPSPVQPTPTPTATPAQAPPSNTGTTRGEAPAPTPSAPPSPAAGPLGFSWGFEGAPATMQDVPASASVVDCATGEVSQSFETSIATERTTYAAIWSFNAASSAAVKFKLSEGGHDVSYDGGAAEVRVSRGDPLILEAVGSYSRIGSGGRQNDLPEYGRFSVRLEIDCGTSSITSEWVSLSRS